MSFPTQDEWSRAHHLRHILKFLSSSKIMDFDLEYDGWSNKGTLCWCCSPFVWLFSEKETLLEDELWSMSTVVSFVEGFIVEFFLLLRKMFNFRDQKLLIFVRKLYDVLGWFCFYYCKCFFGNLN
jgi:hypothetical protein